MEGSLTSKKVLFQNSIDENCKYSSGVNDENCENASGVNCENFINSSNIEPLVVSNSRSRNRLPLRRYNSDFVFTEQSKNKKSSSNLRRHPTSSDALRPASPVIVMEGICRLQSVEENASKPESSRKDKSLGLLSEK